MVRNGGADALIQRYIEPDPLRTSRADARLKDSKVAVWALAGYFQNGSEDLAQAAVDYHLSIDQIEAAFAYYQRHRAVIDDRLHANAL